MEENKKHGTVDRREQILKLISEKGKVYVNELSAFFKVSEVTIRNDLDQLEKKNHLIRARGGAMKIKGHVALDFKLSDKNKLHYSEKIAIGKKAISLINENETIIIDSGTTTAEIAKNLSTIKNLTVVTNAINIVNILAQFPDINVIIPGGYLRKNSLSLVGPFAEEFLANFYCDKLFLGVDSFNFEFGLSTPNVEEASINKIMIKMSKEIIVLADSSKFNKRSFAHICDSNKINTLITDSGISEDIKNQFAKIGVNVIVV